MDGLIVDFFFFLTFLEDSVDNIIYRDSPCEQFWQGQGCAHFDVVHQAFPLPTTASPTLQGALRDGFGEAVVACDMPEPCKFPSLDIGQKRFLWTHKEINLAPHPVVGLVLQVDAERLPQALGLGSPDSFFFLFSVSEQGPCFTAVEGNR